jgi:hypothetical protein
MLVFPPASTGPHDQFLVDVVVTYLQNFIKQREEFMILFWNNLFPRPFFQILCLNSLVDVV